MIYMLPLLDLLYLGIVSAVATVAVDYFMFYVVFPRIINRILKGNEEKYNPKSDNGLNIDISYKQEIGGVQFEPFGLHLRGQNTGSIIETIAKMFMGKKTGADLGASIYSVLTDKNTNADEKLKKILEIIH